MLFGGTYYSQIFGVRVFHHLVTTGLLSLWLIARLIRRRGLPPTPLNPLLYLGVIVWFASAIFSLDPRMGLENIWFPITNLLIFFVMVDLLQSGRESLLLETQFLLGALVVMLAGAQLGSWLFGWGFATPSVGWLSVLGADLPLPLTLPKLFVPLGVTTWLAAYTSPLAILAAAWGLSARRIAAKRALIGLALLLVIIMLLTASRGGWISLGAGIAVFALLRIVASPQVRQWIRRLAVPLAVVVIVGMAVGALAVIKLSADPGHSSGDVLRFDLWRGAVQIAADHPVLGVGPGEFGRAYRLYRDPTTVDDRLGTAHNFYLNTFAETGIIGLILAVALGAVLLRAWWNLWRAADTPTRKLHLEGALAALIGFGVQSGFDTFTSLPLVLLALLLAAYCVTPIRSRLDPPLPGSRPAAAVSLLIVLIFGAGLFRADQAQAEFIASTNNHSSEQAQAAVALDPALHLYTLQTAYLTSDPAQAIPAYQAALALEPTWDTGWINLAGLYQQQNQIPAALDALQHAIDINHANGALLLWARLAEATHSAPDDQIAQAYHDYLDTSALGGLPLSAFWSQTPLRQQVISAYAAELPLDLRYRVLAAQAPDQRTALVPADPQSAAEWWVTGEYALTVSNDRRGAMADFTQAIARGDGGLYQGDYYASRARARLTLDPPGAQRDLKIAELLGTYNEYPNAISAKLAGTPQATDRYLAAAVPPRVIEQNFEGVLFGGRVASFDVPPEMRLPGPGHSVMQPWYDLAANYLSAGDSAQAANVYRAILDRAPDETEARQRLADLSGS